MALSEIVIAEGRTCAAETAAVIGQCNEHAQFVLGVGLVIGFAVGLTAMIIGRWYRGRK
jgi:ABC-type uncharacterized transport system permease subunit